MKTHGRTFQHTALLLGNTTWPGIIVLVLVAQVWLNFPISFGEARHEKRVWMVPFRTEKLPNDDSCFETYSGDDKTTTT